MTTRFGWRRSPVSACQRASAATTLAAAADGGSATSRTTGPQDRTPGKRGRRRCLDSSWLCDGNDDLLLQPRADAYGPTLLLPGSPTGFRTVRAITEAQTLGLETWLTTHSELTIADWDGDGSEDLLLRGRDGAVVQNPLLNPQDMVHASDMISDQTYVVYLPPELLL